MLDFVIFAFTAILGLGLVLILYYVFPAAAPPDKRFPSAASFARAKFPPGWDREPADSNSGDLGELSKHGSLHEYLLFLHKHGQQPICTFYWGTQRVVSVCSAELFKETIKLTYRPKLLFSLFEPLIGACSIQYANGLDWEERRKALYPTLRDEFLESYLPGFVQIANETGDKWSKLSPADSVSLQEEFFIMTFKGMTRSCLGDVFEDDEEIKELSDAYHKCWHEMEQRLHLGEPSPGSEREESFNSGLKVINAKVQQILRERTEGQSVKELPFIDALLQSAVPEEQIVCDTVTFLVGGIHTSGYLLVWSLYYLILNPPILEKLVSEMRQKVSGDRQNKLKEYVFSSSTYLRQVLDESLRMSTLAPYAARFSDHDIVVGGYRIPAGTPIVLALGVSLKNKCLWADSTETFNPEHCRPGFLQGRETLALSPFGTGRRKCPGYMFSYVEVGAFLTVLLQQFTLHAEGPWAEKGVKKVHGLVSTPSEDLRVSVAPRVGKP